MKCRRTALRLHLAGLGSRRPRRPRRHTFCDRFNFIFVQIHHLDDMLCNINKGDDFISPWDERPVNCGVANIKNSFQSLSLHFRDKAIFLKGCHIVSEAAFVTANIRHHDLLQQSADTHCCQTWQIVLESYINFLQQPPDVSRLSILPEIVKPIWFAAEYLRRIISGLINILAPAGMFELNCLAPTAAEHFIPVATLYWVLIVCPRRLVGIQHIMISLSSAFIAMIFDDWHFLFLRRFHKLFVSIPLVCCNRDRLASSA